MHRLSGNVSFDKEKSCGAPLVSIEGKLLVGDALQIVSRNLDQWGPHQNERLARCMRDLGWSRKQLRDDGERRYFYVKGDEPYSKVMVTVDGSITVRMMPQERMPRASLEEFFD